MKRHILVAALLLIVFVPSASAQVWPDPSGETNHLGYWAQLDGRTENGVSVQEPLLFWASDGQPQWFAGLDVANSANGDFVIGKINPPSAAYPSGSMGDTIYLKAYPDGNAIGLNMTPPMRGRVVIGNHSTYTDPSLWPSLWIAGGQGQTGEAIRVTDGSSASGMEVTGRWLPNGALEARSVQASAVDTPTLRASAVTTTAITASGSVTAPSITATSAIRTPVIGTTRLDTARLRLSEPRGHRSRCARGEIAWSANYLFVCVATNRWKRARLSDW